jgi:hypothetical protein
MKITFDCRSGATQGFDSRQFRKAFEYRDDEYVTTTVAVMVPPQQPESFDDQADVEEIGIVRLAPRQVHPIWFHASVPMRPTRPPHISPALLSLSDDD